MTTFTFKMENPQIYAHVHKSLTFTAFDVKWIPISARFVALGSNPNGTGTMEIYELEGTDAQLRKKITKPKAFKCGTFGAASQNTRHIATGNFDGQLDLWDLENTDNPVYSAKDHQKIINSIDGIGGLGKGYGAPELVTGGRDGAVKVWDIRQPDKPVANMEPAEAAGARDCWIVTFGNSYNNEERYICAGYDNGDVKLFDLRAMKTQWETNVKNGVCSLDFNRKDIKMERLVVTTLESNYHVFDMKTQDSKKEFPSFTKTAHKGTIWCVKHSPQNRDLFMTTGGSGSVCLWKYISPLQANNELGAVELLREEMVSSQPISSLDWSPDKQGLAVCTSFDQAFRLLIITKLNRF